MVRCIMHLYEHKVAQPLIRVIREWFERLSMRRRTIVALVVISALLIFFLPIQITTVRVDASIAMFTMYGRLVVGLSVSALDTGIMD